MRRPLIIGLLITFVISGLVGIVVTIQTGGPWVIVNYYSLFMFTTYLPPILLACFFYYYLQRLFHPGYTAGGMLVSFLLLLLWFEVVLFAWAALVAVRHGTSIDLQFILNEFMKKNRNLWTGVLCTSMVIVLINLFMENRGKQKRAGITPGL